MALAIAEHCSMLACDHIGEACRAAFSDSTAATHFKMHRTKCTEMINGVLAPYFLKKLVADVGDQRFSLLLDESTDISVSKYLGVVIRYFSDTKQTVVSTFLGLVELEGGDARSIACAVVGFLVKCGLKKEKLLGIGTDNASVMTGVNNGVHKVLKEEYGLKDLVLIRCVCHSLQLAVSHASNDTIPRSVEYLVRETYNWFSVSPKRREAYKAIYETINCGEKPLQITKVCATRWLSIEPAVSRILDQWEELRLHFSVTKSSEHCYMAEVLYSMYSDPQNILYLTFLKSVLGEVQLAIKAFEGEQVDPLKLLESLVSLIKSVSSRVLNPLAKTDVLKGPIDGDISPKPYLGYLFESKAAELHLVPEHEINVRKRCVAFTISLTNELRVRLPDNIEALQYMSVFNVEETLKHNKSPGEIGKIAKLLGYSPADIDKIVQQWRAIHLSKWNETKNTMSFWSEIMKFRDAADINPFQELAMAAVSVLSLPHSNAEMSVVKSKLRNRMSLQTLNSILYIRYGLKLSGEACYEHQLPDNVLQLFGTSAAYSFKSAPSVAEPAIESLVQNDDEPLFL
ncbi:hypothetical protein M9458_008748, partial [Cirrhinus mrigala]|uniref:DUF4371 domain-containing protein n=1 Tax=Cirrhinus mrigala TaxID=683832 RepID=A0ABD0R7X3_CIRMR